MRVLALLALAFAPQESAPSTPPGLVLVHGGRTRVGSTFEQVEDLIRERPELYLAVPGEAPQFALDVADFFLMPTEVTNEQYAAFVRATDARPPRTWGVAALRAGQVAFLDEQARAKQEAQATGKPFEARAFDPAAWWNEHWREAGWEVPTSDATHPVVQVTYSDAERYARWAGVRLMTEFEYQRAGRESSGRTYPWGDDWDDKRYCQSLHSGRDSTASVGSFAAGAVNGIHDLVGNVWEWTASPFTPYPGYRPVRVELKDRVVEGFGPFDEKQRVVVGGSFQMDRAGVRLAIRKYTDPTQSTSALGFRCAASVRGGPDAARAILPELAPGVLADGAAWDTENAIALRRWESAAGQVTVPGYRVITGYEHVLLCPITSLPVATPTELPGHARGRPLVLGLVALPRPLSAPELDRGTYVLAWRAAGPTTVGETRARDAAYDGSALRDVPGFDAERDSFLLCDLNGTPLAALPAPAVTAARQKPCRIELAPAVEGATSDFVRFHLCIPSTRTSSKGLVFEVELALRAGSLGSGWN